MDPQLIEGILALAFGLFIGLLPASNRATDWIILAIWAIAFAFSPSVFYGSVLGGYIGGLIIRFLINRQRLKSKETEDQDST